MTNVQGSGSGLTGLGKFFSMLLIVGLVGLGGWIAWSKMNGRQGGGGGGPQTQAGAQGSGGGGGAAAAVTFDMSDLKETETEAPRLVGAQAYVPKDNIIDIEISEYSGYGGLIAANGGLVASEESVFFKKYGFKVNLKVSEEESWNALNAGRMAASVTTADVLAVYGRQFQVIVPAQIGYSRGADGLVVRSDIRKVNDLKGKVVAASQFTESDFFIRYLAREAGMNIRMLPDLNAAVDPEAINLVYCKDGMAAGDLFVKALKAGSKAVAGCVTWAPKTSEIPAESNGKARLLVSNKNLLIIADVLIVNAGFAQKNPEKVAALVDGLLTGNKMVRDNPEANADVIGRAFKWSHEKTLAELQKVHLSNLPEQLAFFGGGVTQVGSFASIYQSSVLAYGTELIPNPVDSDHFASLGALKAAEAGGAYKDQVASIMPLAASSGGLSEVDPVLSKDIQFFFTPNESTLDMSKSENLDGLKAIKRILDVSPGSRVVLVGHVDNSKIPEFRMKGGEAAVKQGELDAMDLSKKRATEVMTQLVSREKVDKKRLETVGRGWIQPVSADNPALNRRVEVQWFTLE